MIRLPIAAAAALLAGAGAMAQAPAQKEQGELIPAGPPTNVPAGQPAQKKAAAAPEAAPRAAPSGGGSAARDANGQETGAPAAEPEAAGPPAGRGAAELQPDWGEDRNAPDPVPGHAAPTRSGFLGISPVVDALLLAFAMLASALLGAWLGSRKSSRSPLPRMVNSLSERVLQLESDLARLRAAAGTVPPSARTPAEPARRQPSPDDDGGAAAATREASRADPGTGAAAQEAARAMQAASDEYLRLVATRGAKPRQFADLLSRFPVVLGVVQDGTGAAEAPFGEGGANQVLVAAGDGQRFAVLPTYDYIANFRIAFSTAMTNPEIVRRLFELDEDDTRQLRVEHPAIVEREEGGRLRVVRKGRLSGFTS